MLRSFFAVDENLIFLALICVVAALVRGYSGFAFSAVLDESPAASALIGAGTSASVAVAGVSGWLKFFFSLSVVLNVFRGFAHTLGLASMITKACAHG